jgi:hypothetical protein
MLIFIGYLASKKKLRFCHSSHKPNVNLRLILFDNSCVKVIVHSIIEPQNLAKFKKY